MNHRLVLAALAAPLALVIGGAAAAAVTVTYAEADKMTDVPRFQSEREGMEADFREHLDTLAKQLAPGQDLTVEFLDIDLAGDVFPRVPVRDVRIMKGTADWPRMHLRYQIEQDGKVLRSGESRLADPNYQMNINSYRNDMYAYEKRMLDAWFKKEILEQR